RVEAGDTISATVEVDRAQTSVHFRIENRTRGWRLSRRLPVSSPNLASAEWIVEAPAGCNRLRCGSMRLADFGSVRLARVATVGNGHRGTILDRRWRATAIDLTPSARHAYFTGSTAGAVPTALAADGAAFTVAW